MAVPAGKNLDYVKELIKRYEDAVKKVKKLDDPREIAEVERSVQPILNELQMAVPRIFNDFVLITRDRRIEIRESL